MNLYCFVVKYKSLKCSVTFDYIFNNYIAATNSGGYYPPCLIANFLDYFIGKTESSPGLII